jgi:predicted TIM-barrel fold metal-dependent hydrolase
MVIDVHYHMMPMVTEQVAERLYRDVLRSAQIMRKSIDKASFCKTAIETYSDPTGDRLIQSMDQAGIDFTCICAVDNVGNESLTTEVLRSYNQLVGEIAQKHPQRLMALAGIDPRRPGSPDLMKECFEEFGARGLKYHPDYGYDPGGRESYRLLEIVQDNRGVLLSHTGSLGPPSRCRYADPMLLADLAVDFPELKVIAAHMGQVNWRPWADLASHQPNLYGDLAMWDAFAFGRYELFCRELRDLIDYAGVAKVLFATDNPVFSVLQPTRKWVQLIRDLPHRAPAGIRFTQDEVDAILGGNAATVLGLEEESVSNRVVSG